LKKFYQSGLFVKILLSGFLLVLVFGAALDLTNWYTGMKNDVSKIPYRLTFLFFLELTFFILVYLHLWIPKIFDFIVPLRNKLRIACYLVAFGLTLFYFYLRTNGLDGLFSGFYTQITLFLFFIYTFGILFSRKKALTWNGLFSGIILFSAFTAIFSALAQATDFPFSLTWSEGNRIWEYSTFFGSDRYNLETSGRIKTLTSVGRTFLWGIPFLIPDISIKMVRIWDVIVFSVPYLLFGWAIFDSEKKNNLSAWLVIGFSTYVFLNQAPVYSPLVLAALLVALTRKSTLWLAIPAVVLATYYANISRYTWIFAPGMWAVMCALIDRDFSKQPGFWSNWKKSILLAGSALVGGFAIPPIIDRIFSNPAISDGVVNLEKLQKMGSDHPLMWNRLFPNATYGLGIILNLGLVTLPLIILVLLPIITKKWKINIWQKLVLLGFPLLFLLVGLVVSTKVGGGNNLHNLDMFFISIVFLASLSWKHGLREIVLHPNPTSKWAYALILAFVLVPAWKNMSVIRPVVPPSQEHVMEALTSLKTAVMNASQKGEVLFMDQRQIITFGHVGDLPLVTEYEKKVVMNAAMANDQVYFDQYYNDLKSKRFSLIVTEPLTIHFQKENQAFQYENNTWVKWVSIPTTCYYKSIYRSDEFLFELFVPRDQVLGAVRGYRCPN